MLLDWAKVTTCCHGVWSGCFSCCSSYSRCCLCNVTVQHILRLFYQSMSQNHRDNKSCNKKVYMSKTCQAHMRSYRRLTRANKENNLHKLTDSLNTYT